MPLPVVRPPSRAAIVLAAAVLLIGTNACTASKTPVGRRSTPAGAGGARNNDPRVIARAAPPQLSSDEIPACFVQAEPQAAPAGERTELFRPVGPTPRPSSSPAVPRTPEVSRLATTAPFPLYALAAPGPQYVPVLLRYNTVPAGNDQRATLFAVQYRAPAQRGAVVVLSTPSTVASPPRDDLDDALDAVRLQGRLSGTPQAADPLADPAIALQALGCPSHEIVRVPLDGVQHPADLITWPGAPGVYFLRIETGRVEVTLETGQLQREGVLALPGALTTLQQSPQTVVALQGVFGGATPLQHSATPARRAGTGSPTASRTKTPTPTTR